MTEKLRILVACEESQRVTKELRRRGHEAYSCDIKEMSGGFPEWHINQDVLPLLNGNCSFKTMDGEIHTIECKWDMIVAFPPCTHLAISGTRLFQQKRESGVQREAIEFFCKFFEADCDKIAIENPKGIIGGGNYIKEFFPDLAEKYDLPRTYNQIIQPWMFGDLSSKSTCLWLKGLPELVPEITEKPDIEYVEYTNKSGKVCRMDRWNYELSKKSKSKRAELRSKTFRGVARAIAEQWA